MALIKCTECGAMISDKAKGCPQCGAPMPIKCAECGKLLSPNAVMCPHCGCPTSGENGKIYEPVNTRRRRERKTLNQGWQEMNSKMSFGEAIAQCFSKYATFSGRARRSEYWYFALFSGLINLLWSVLALVIMGVDVVWGSVAYCMNIIYVFVLFLPSLAVMVRRLHDVGKSGGNVFWSFLPLIGLIILLPLLIGDSEPCENEYGPSPKYN